MEWNLYYAPVCSVQNCNGGGECKEILFKFKDT